MRYSVCLPTANVYACPAISSTIDNKESQLLFGEIFVANGVQENGFLYGRCDHDGYEGWILNNALQAIEKEPEYKTIYPFTSLHPKPDFKSRPEMTISMFSCVSLSGKEENGFGQTLSGHWIYMDNLASIHEGAGLDLKNKNNKVADLADIASYFIGAPYLYGGRSFKGLDCSALIQLSMIALEHKAPPRDSANQSQYFKDFHVDRKNLQRNDLVYFPGHVGIMVDEQNIINATARHMRTLIEPLSDLEPAYREITACVRLPLITDKPSLL